MACYKITSITTTGGSLKLVIPRNLTVKNGERACFCICATIPASTTVLPVYFNINGTLVPLYDMLGNALYSDQIRAQVRIPGVWGTNPNHFKLCACVEGRSQATATQVTIPATATEEVDDE